MREIKDLNGPLLTEIELSELLSMDRGTLRNWRSAGIGPTFIKIGRSVRYKLSDILDYLNVNTRTSTKG